MQGFMNLLMTLHRLLSRRPPNKSLDASGGSVFLNQPDAAKGCFDSRRRVNSTVGLLRILIMAM
jgi:hypothetical protein